MHKIAILEEDLFYIAEITQLLMRSPSVDDEATQRLEFWDNLLKVAK